MNTQRLAENAKSLFGIDITTEQQEQMRMLATEMLRWNAERANLTSIVDPDEIETKHFLDSLSLLGPLMIEPNSRIADVGSGAGFPGLVLKIVRPDLGITFIESVGKKSKFIEHFINLMGFENMEVLTMRVEDVAHKEDHREQYDVVVARAVAYMPTLVEYLLPLVKIGGYCVAMKGTGAAEETKEATKALRILGGKAGAVHEIVLPMLDAPHYLVVINKVKKTPGKFPRQAGTPKKLPLR